MMSYNQIMANWGNLTVNVGQPKSIGGSLREATFKQDDNRCNVGYDVEGTVVLADGVVLVDGATLHEVWLEGFVNELRVNGEVIF